jgi:hypothetical protein
MESDPPWLREDIQFIVGKIEIGIHFASQAASNYASGNRIRARRLRANAQTAHDDALQSPLRNVGIYDHAGLRLLPERCLPSGLFQRVVQQSLVARGHDSQCARGADSLGTSSLLEVCFGAEGPV